MRKIFYSLAILFAILLTSFSIQDSFSDSGENRTYTLEEALEIQRQRIESSESAPVYVGFEKPLKQIAQGILPENVTCNKELVLIIKHTGMPACVKHDTALILVERNFGTSDDILRYHEIESVRNCEIGKIFHYIGLGSFSITIENMTLETCYMTFHDEIEGGVIERYCEIPLEKLQNFRGWGDKIYSLPNLEGLEEFCKVTETYSIWDRPPFSSP